MTALAALNKHGGFGRQLATMTAHCDLPPQIYTNPAWEGRTGCNAAGRERTGSWFRQLESRKAAAMQRPRCIGMLCIQLFVIGLKTSTLNRVRREPNRFGKTSPTLNDTPIADSMRQAGETRASASDAPRNVRSGSAQPEPRRAHPCRRLRIAWHGSGTCDR